MKAKAVAPANIAFIKYWGKIDGKLRLPANASISMNLDSCLTTTTVEFDSNLSNDEFILNGVKVVGEESERVSKHIDTIRSMSKIDTFAKVKSENNFPKSSGIASSASGFAALTLAASAAAGLKLSEKDLSILARIGSGSSCRSIPDGIVEWKYGEKNEDSYAHSLFGVDYWDIRDIIVIVGAGVKKVSSSEGHSLADSSPFYKTRILGMPQKVEDIKRTLENKDFTKFGEILEAEAVNMHTVMMTSVPPLYYWLPETLRIMRAVSDLRESGTECYFTIDAGPNVHVICEGKNAPKISLELAKIEGVKNLIENKVGRGAYLA